MRAAFLVVVLAAAMGYQFRVSPVESALARNEAPKTVKPFGIDKRAAWTTSRVVGSPDPAPPYRVKRAFDKLKIDYPIAVAHEPETHNLLLINQTRAWVGPGRVWRIAEEGNGEKSELLLSLDRTMYGFTFHPDFKNNGYLYIGSNGPITSDDKDIPGRRFRPESPKTTRISRFTIDRKPPFACDPKSETIIIDWPANGHNGGDVTFGRDGMLYISAGDGTFDSDTDVVGQDLTRLTAKVLRIDVDHPTADKAYSIPMDNPFLHVKEARPETWAYGFRNPWRLHADRQTGDLWAGQNGQDLWEQVYLVERGANYGWSLVEGSHPFLPNRKQGPTPISKPIAEHHHSESRSITGGLVYRGKELPELQGAYLYGDWATGLIWGIRHDKGKVTWHKLLAETTLQITGFGLDSQGELLIVDYGGGLYRLEPSPKDVAPPAFPTKLSETGLFKSVKDHQPEAGVIPYSVNAPLWSDGAEKERFLALPGDAKIDFTSDRGWNFTDGTVLVKTFSLGKRRVETRLLTRQRGQWAGYSYIWNDEQTDATLVPAAGMDRAYNLDGGKKQQTWHYPSRTECIVCHSRAANYVLGLSLLQMNKEHDYGGVIDNQLRTFEHLGLFRVAALEQFQDIKRLLVPRWWHTSLDGTEEEFRRRPGSNDWLPRRPENYPRLVDPADARANLDARVRSYLHANCAQCHVRAGGGNAAIDLEFTTTLDKARLIDERPQHQAFNIPEALLVAPGHPERSVLQKRIEQRGPGQMPPLASSMVDEAAVKLLKDWIAGMK